MQNYHPPCKLPLYKTAFNGEKSGPTASKQLQKKLPTSGENCYCNQEPNLVHVFNELGLPITLKHQPLISFINLHACTEMGQKTHGMDVKK